MPRRFPPAPGLPAGFDPDAAAGNDGGIFGLPFSPAESRVVIVPVPFEATTSYGGGAARGPAAVLQASRQVDLHDRQTGDPYRHGIAMDPIPVAVQRWNREACRLARPILQRGGAIGSSRKLAAARQRVDEIGGRVNGWVRRRTAALLDEGRIPAVLGGDHSVAFGAVQACAEAYPGLGILHVDAHADLREAYEGFTWSHASILFNVVTRIPGVARVAQVGLRDLGHSEEERIRRSPGRIRAWFDADSARHTLSGKPWTTLARAAVRWLPKEVYVSFDIDGLDPALCPGTGTPVPGGLSWNEALVLLETLALSGRRIVGLDLCEVAPSAGSDWDANVGARLLYKLIGFALLSRRRRRSGARRTR